MVLNHPIEPKTVDSKYNDWIDNNSQQVLGRCAVITLAMAAKFSELTRVRGHYYCDVWGEREHWWLKTEKGEIIDPTANQFPSKGHGKYVEFVEGSPEPTGKCPNCGGYCYGGSYTCSSACDVEYHAYMASELGG